MQGSVPDRFVDVTRADGDVREVRVVEGHVFVCEGCCCGNVAKAVPKVPLEAFKGQWKSRGIRRRVHLTIAGCLGPCAVANVVLLVLYGRTVWLHSIDSTEQVTEIYDYVERTLAAEEYVPLEGWLARHEFDRYSCELAECAPMR